MRAQSVMFLLNAQSAARLRSVYEDYYKPEANIYELPEYLRYAPNGKPLVSADLGELKAAGAAVEDLTKEAPIHISNLSLIDPKSGKATRISIKKTEDGKKAMQYPLLLLRCAKDRRPRGTGC